MWRDIRITVEDLSREKSWPPRRICKTFGLSRKDVAGITRRHRGPLAARQKKRELTMVDPTETEIAALRNAAAMGGEYLDALGKTDLASLEEDEWMTFVEVLVTGYLDHMTES